MARKPPPPSITSADASQSDDSGEREKRYMITMAIRIVCLVLMVVVQPFGWHTLAFFLGAAFLPYIAVINANNGRGKRRGTITAPEAAIEHAAADAPDTGAHTDDEHLVIRIEQKNDDPA